jgi:hypothetical protein
MGDHLLAAVGGMEFGYHPSSSEDQDAMAEKQELLGVPAGYDLGHTLPRPVCKEGIDLLTCSHVYAPRRLFQEKQVGFCG